MRLAQNETSKKATEQLEGKQGALFPNNTEGNYSTTRTYPMVVKVTQAKL